ncbi:MAG: CubicO group peptidase beta-lactamase class family [Jatrophihabitantaceae bacterium]|nr:CubicO group peptidase beta-lactamase class family [Jatrophihabitantaceae bacterium]
MPTFADALRGLDDWPVGLCAAAVVGPEGVRAAYGPGDAIFALASVTKPLAALAVLVAVEEEAVSLDDPADPADPGLLPGATLRHLLAHASGIRPDSFERIAAPATRRIYSNAGYELAGRHIAAATGIFFPDYAHEALAPLGLRHTTLDGSPARDGRSCVDDLAVVLGELLAPGRLLHPDTLADATAVAFPGLRGVVPGFGMQDPCDWATGFELRSTKAPHWMGAANSHSTFGHFGQTGTMLWVDPVAGVGLVALADRAFGPWAAAAWPIVSDAVLAAV